MRVGDLSFKVFPSLLTVKTRDYRDGYINYL